MATIEKLVVRDEDGRTEGRSVLQRAVAAVRGVGDAVRGAWSGPLSLKSPEMWLGGGTPSSSGVHVSDAAALGVAPLLSGASTIAEDIAALPLVLLRRLPNGGKERFYSHPLYTLLHDRPNPEMTSIVFRSTLVFNAVLHGNSYAEIERDVAGRPVALWPLPPDSVSVIRDGSILRYRVHNGNGRNDVVLDAADMIHIKGVSPDGVLGFDLIEIAKHALGLTIAAEQFGGSFFRNGATMGGSMSVPGVLTEPQRKATREIIEARHQGAERAHRLLLLEGGASFQPHGANPRDSQYIELRTFQIREVARFLRMPPSKLGDLADATYSNVTEENLRYYTGCLRGWIERVEQEFSAKLISPSEQRIQIIEHITTGFLSGDHAARAAYYSAMLAHGVFSINDVRALENMGPIEGGNTPRVPMNTEPVGARGRQ